MPGSLTIGDFSRVTFLSVKTLRHYHRAGLLEPAEVDPVTGYRRYTIAQIPVAQVIRRFRDLDMPLDDIGSVLRAPDQTTRSQLIADHLTRMEETLAETQRAVASLRDLLEHPSRSPVIEHRWVPVTPAAAITSTVAIADLDAWYQGAIGEIQGTLSAQDIVASGPPGGIYANELFADERGDATLFFPVIGEFRPVGRVGAMSVPEAELAVITHSGSHDDLDRSYGALATYVSEHALAVDGQIRECYVVGPHDTDDELAWRTEIGWPIFETRPQPTMTQRTHDDVASSGAHQDPAGPIPGSLRDGDNVREVQTRGESMASSVGAPAPLEADAAQMQMPKYDSIRAAACG